MGISLFFQFFMHVHMHFQKKFNGDNRWLCCPEAKSQKVYRLGIVARFGKSLNKAPDIFGKYFGPNMATLDGLTSKQVDIQKW